MNTASETFWRTRHEPGDRAVADGASGACVLAGHSPRWTEYGVICVCCGLVPVIGLMAGLVCSHCSYHAKVAILRFPAPAPVPVPTSLGVSVKPVPSTNMAVGGMQVKGDESRPRQIRNESADTRQMAGLGSGRVVEPGWLVMLFCWPSWRGWGPNHQPPTTNDQHDNTPHHSTPH